MPEPIVCDQIIIYKLKQQTCRISSSNHQCHMITVFQDIRCLIMHLNCQTYPQTKRTRNPRLIDSVPICYPVIIQILNIQITPEIICITIPWSASPIVFQNRIDQKSCYTDCKNNALCPYNPTCRYQFRHPIIKEIFRSQKQKIKNCQSCYGNI